LKDGEVKEGRGEAEAYSFHKGYGDSSYARKSDREGGGRGKMIVSGQRGIGFPGNRKGRRGGRGNLSKERKGVFCNLKATHKMLTF